MIWTDSGNGSLLFYMQNEIELAPRSIRRKYVSIQQYCDYLRMVLNLNEIFFRFTARKFQLPRTLPRTLSREEIKELILAAAFQYQQARPEENTVLIHGKGRKESY